MAEQVISWNDINTQYIDEGDLAYVVPMTSGKNYFDQEPELLGTVINVTPSEIRVEPLGEKTLPDSGSGTEKNKKT